MRGAGDPGALGHGRRMCKHERKENTDFSTKVIVVLGIVTERTYYMYVLFSSVFTSHQPGVSFFFLPLHRFGPPKAAGGKTKRPNRNEYIGVVTSDLAVRIYQCGRTDDLLHTVCNHTRGLPSNILFRAKQVRIKSMPVVK